MDLGCWHPLRGLALMLVAAVTTGCSDDDDDPPPWALDNIVYRESLSNGPVLTERSSAWVCRTSIGEGEGAFAEVWVMRFFDDGRMIFGVGEEEERMSWDLTAAPVRGSYSQFLTTSDEPPWLSAFTLDEPDLTLETSISMQGPGSNGDPEFEVSTFFEFVDPSDDRASSRRYAGNGNCNLFDENGIGVGGGSEGKPSAVYNPLGLQIPEEATADTDSMIENEREEEDSGAEPADDSPLDPDDEPASAEADDDAGDENDPPIRETDTASNGARPLGDIQDDIEAIWYLGDIGDVVSVVNGLASPFYSVVEFEDGSATTDGTFLSQEGVRASRREHPERWGEARVQGGVFGFKLDGERSWQEPEFAVRTRFPGRGVTLTGCFRASSGQIAGPVASLSFRSVCFDAEGRFAFDGATSTSGGGGSGAVASAARGDYLIDQRAIRLEYDDGERRDRLFGVYSEDGFVEAIVLGSEVLDAER